MREKRNLAARTTALLMLLAFACVPPRWAYAADAEDTVARTREMLRRTQEALRQAQSDNADLTRAKTEAEQQLKAATQGIETAKSASKAAQSAQAQMQLQLDADKAAQASLEQKLAEANEQQRATSAKLGETSQLLAARESELTQVRQDLERSRTQTASCEAKNVTLYGYATEVLQRYKDKGVWAALSQKDPVLGLKEVDVENVVQEYRLKFESEKVKPQ